MRCQRGAVLCVLAALIGGIACVPPRLKPLAGETVAAGRLPATQLSPGYRKIVFSWELQDGEMNARGEGAARVAPPDSVRMDFFLGGGLAQGGAAVLIGDSVRVPRGAGDFVARLIPPPPLLWAVLGRVALPNLQDTVVRVEDSTLRADIGRPIAWRFTFRGDSIVRAEHVESGRVTEWIERADSARVRYRNESTRRSLRLTILRVEEASGFDADIWRFGR